MSGKFDRIESIAKNIVKFKKRGKNRFSENVRKKYLKSTFEKLRFKVGRK